MITVIKLMVRELLPEWREGDESFAIIEITEIKAHEAIGNSDGSLSEKQIVSKSILSLHDIRAMSKVIMLNQGEYLVVIRLPNGEILSEHVSLVSAHDATGISFDSDLVARSRVTSRRKESVRANVEEDLADFVFNDPLENLTYSDTIVIAQESDTLFSYPDDPLLSEKTPDTNIVRFSASKVRTPSKWSEYPVNSISTLALGTESRFERLHSGNGILRIEAAINRNEIDAALSESGSENDLLQAMLGRAISVKPERIITSFGDSMASWKKNPRKSAEFQPSSPEFALSRRFFALAEGIGREQNSRYLACIPASWPNSIATGKNSAIAVGVSAHRTSGIEVKIKDPAVHAMLQFMQSGDANSALTLVKPSLLILFNKRANPYAATAAAYALLYSRNDSTPQHWHQWVENLGDWFPEIPDGLILQAVILLQGANRVDFAQEIGSQWSRQFERINKALAAVTEAIGRGPPLFRQGLSLLESTLNILAQQFPRGTQQSKKIQRMNDVIFQLRLLADPSQAFSVFDVASIPPQ